MPRLPPLILAALLLLAPAALAHPERTTFFPDARVGHVPALHRGGATLVVCKPGSRAAVRREFTGRSRATRLRLLRRCRFRHIQSAVNRARSGARILVMPGTYREQPSRRVPVDQRRCAGMFETPADGDAPVPTYEHQLKCPNSRNLVAIIGDTNGDRRCDRHCNLELRGMGRRPRDTVVQGDRHKKDVIRADRADGVIIRNLQAEQGAFNDIDVVETNGFRLQRLVTAYGQNYGILTFTSDHGLYSDIEAFANGDSGVYPGSGPEGHCKRYGIEIRRVNSHDNVLGYSGTAGNGTWTHDSRFERNSAGVSTDSFASGHPGMPQDCSKWTDNVVASNNQNFFVPERQAYCRDTPFDKRPKTIVCPQFQVPVGSGLIFYGANQNLVRGNWIYDNWRSGTRLFSVPAAVRGDTDPAHQTDTSNGNRYEGNRMGVRPDGTADPNGVDFFWDEGGGGNCWTANAGPGGARPTSDPAVLPGCPNPLPWAPSNPAKLGAEAPCASWDPRTNPQPPGCTWFTTPPEPQPASAGSPGLPAGAPAGLRVDALAARAAPLAWQRRPLALGVLLGTGGDRILTGTVRNASRRTLVLRSARLRVLDAAGSALPHTGRFISGFVHDLWPPTQRPPDIGDRERTRLGYLVRLRPGASAPLTVSWRGAAARVDLGEGWLPVEG